MTGLLLTSCAGAGTYLLYTAVAFGWRGLRPNRAPWRDVAMAGGHQRLREWMVQSGLADVRVSELVVTSSGLLVVGGLVGMALFGAPLPAAVLALAAGLSPLASCRVRRQHVRARAREAWPRIVEEIRLLLTGLGRSVPQALFEAGLRGPAELRPAFEAAQREWNLSTDFERTITVLKARLADPTADAVCETLLVAHQVGGTDLDRRLAALIEDRVIDVQGRKDALAEQAAVRFARRFVLLVPCGMALAGTSIGTGRDAYRTSWGQALVALGVSVVAACWLWAGRLLRLPDEERVFR
jgi:tight adherence protein B